VKRITYLRCAAALPIAVPIILIPLVRTGVGIYVGFLVWGGIFGGIPYTLAAGTALCLIRNFPASSYWRLARWAPPIFVMVFELFILGLALIQGRGPIDTGNFFTCSSSTA